jgi:hypothetical protein
MTLRTLNGQSSREHERAPARSRGRAGSALTSATRRYKTGFFFSSGHHPPPQNGFSFDFATTQGYIDLARETFREEAELLDERLFGHKSGHK